MNSMKRYSVCHLFTTRCIVCLQVRGIPSGDLSDVLWGDQNEVHHNHALYLFRLNYISHQSSGVIFQVQLIVRRSEKKCKTSKGTFVKKLFFLISVRLQWQIVTAALGKNSLLRKADNYIGIIASSHSELRFLDDDRHLFTGQILMDWATIKTEREFLILFNQLWIPLCFWLNDLWQVWLNISHRKLKNICILWWPSVWFMFYVSCSSTPNKNKLLYKKIVLPCPKKLCFSVNEQLTIMSNSVNWFFFFLSRRSKSRMFSKE